MFYFHAHQPFRIRKFRIFDFKKRKKDIYHYFDNNLNKKIIERVSKKCYIPTNKIILDLIEKYDFKCAFSLTGTLLEQLELWKPEVIDLFIKLVDTGNVELVADTYYHSLAFFFDKEEFRDQVKMLLEKYWDLFAYKPKTFRNTELSYRNDMAKEVERFGFKAILTEGTEKILVWRSPNYLYKAKDSDIILVLKNYRLSDDIAFRFSNPNWEHFPLTADKWSNWVSWADGEVVNIAMDYETFGEHQWPETGIFKFLERLPFELRKRKIDFVLPREFKISQVKDELDVPFEISWADWRGLDAWMSNKMQQFSLKRIYSLKNKVKKLKNKDLIHVYRLLQTSDHFYYMYTFATAEGDIHNYFREEAFSTPYDAFVNYNNILTDFEDWLEDFEVKNLIKEEVLEKGFERKKNLI
ncbi:MAG TPA: alpha-amylase [Nautiliaceae bacterium]|nr:alpha-amylase [Nautiliaceae bacterium]